MRMKAHVYKQYGDAAIMNIVLESLPKVSDLEFIVLDSYLVVFEFPHRLPPRWPLHLPRRMRSS